MTVVICPKCKSQNVRYREKRSNWICDDCDYVFTMSDAFGAQREDTNDMPSKGKIFISYGHDCTPIVDRIMRDLTRLGYSVWVDNYQIKSGDDWRNTITNGILDSQIVLSFLSVHALRSGGVCLDELAIAVGCNHNNIRTCLMEQEAIPLIPSTVNGIEYIDMTEWKSLDGEVFETWYTGKFKEVCHNVESAMQLRQDPILKELDYRLHPSLLFDSFFYELRKGYTAREWLSKRMASWMEDDSRILLFTAYPGGGKSAFCAHYFHQHPHAACLTMCSQFYEDVDETPQILKNIAYQLSQSSIAYRRNLLWTLSNTKRDIDSCTLHELFNLLICMPFQLEIDGNHAPMIIVIDGVDALDKEERNNLADLISHNMDRLPQFVRIILSSRQSGSIINNFMNTSHIEIDPSSPETINDLENYLRREFPTAPPDKMRAVAKRCNGSFLYATLLAQAIKKGVVTLDDKVRLLPQMQQLYYQSMVKLFPHGEDFKPYWRPLTLLIATGGTIPADLLSKYMGWQPHEFNRFYTRLIIFLQRWVDAKGAQWIRIVYPSFISWITNEYHANIFYIPQSLACTELAETIWQEYAGGQSLSEYELANIRLFLTNANQDERLSALISDSHLMHDVVSRIRVLQEDPRNYTQICQLTELCQAIADHIGNANAMRVSKGDLPFLAMQRDFVSGNYWKLLDYYSSHVAELTVYCSETQLLHLLYMAATAFDLIGNREMSVTHFSKLYKASDRCANQIYHFHALVGLLWNDHFSDIEEGKRMVNRLCEIPSEVLEEQHVLMRTLIVARYKLSVGQAEEAFAHFTKIVDDDSMMLWGYNSISAKLQMLLIESMVAAYDNNRFLKGIEIGQMIYSHIGQTVSVSSCYCLSWLVMNHIPCGNYDEAQRLLAEAEYKNQQLQKIGPSDWMSMHLKSVRSQLCHAIGADEEAMKLLQEVIVLAKDTNDWWVLGDAYFEMFCIARLEGSGSISVEETELLYKQLREVADTSGLPHLKFKAMMMLHVMSPSKEGTVILMDEIRHNLIEGLLASTDVFTVLYFCHSLYKIFMPDSEDVGFLYDTIMEKASRIDVQNPGIAYTERNRIVKLINNK